MPRFIDLARPRIDEAKKIRDESKRLRDECEKMAVAAENEKCLDAEKNDRILDQDLMPDIRSSIESTFHSDAHADGYLDVTISSASWYHLRIMKTTLRTQLTLRLKSEGVTNFEFVILTGYKHRLRLYF